MASSLRILAVCTHNRTRSVLMAGLLREHADKVGLAVSIDSAGTEGAGTPPIDDAVRLLAARSIDASSHRSASLTDDNVGSADLVVTAERAHVVSISGQWPGSFQRTFTLPEFVARAEVAGPRGTRPFDQWLDALNESRPTALDYLDTQIAEVADPTGRSPKAWRASFAEIDDLARRCAALIR